MKKKLLLLPFAGLITYLAICGYMTGPGATDGIDGTGASNTGGCYQSGCHSYASSTLVSIELDSLGFPVTQYVAGMSYTIKISGSNTGSSSLPYFGFQIAAVKAAGAGTSSATDAGALASTGLPASCRYTASGTMGLPVSVVEHSAPILATSGTGGSGTTYVESIGWTAPASGTGTVKLFGAINAVNHDGTEGGDAWDTSSVTITERAAPITGTFTICPFTSTTLTSTYSGGTWGSSNPSVAFILPSGVVHAISPGTTTITYNEGAAGIDSIVFTVLPTAKASSISGPSTLCAGSAITLTDDTTGGVWSSGTTSVATVSPGGTVTGISAGTAVITYAVTNACGTADTIKRITVTPGTVVGAITGGSSLCAGSTLTLSDTSTSGSWSTSNSTVATVSSSGVVTGLTAGTDTVFYTETGACGTVSSADVVTVSATADAGSISGAAALCQGDSTILSDGSAGGVWSSSDNTIANISATGTVTGESGGTATIFYTVTNGCGTATTNFTVTVSALANVGFISGTSVVCAGSGDTLSETATGGTWSITGPAATIDTNGVVTTMAGAGGIDTVSYSASNSCGANAATFIIGVVSSTAGTIGGDTSLCIGTPVLLSDTLAGGAWSVSNGSAEISISSGIIVGVAPGSDTVFYEVTSICGISVSSFVVTITECGAASVKSVSAPAEFKVYPNPSSGGLFSLQAPQNGSDVVITVTDLTGKVIVTNNLGAVQAAELDLSTLPAGNYILKADQGSATYREKISILK